MLLWLSYLDFPERVTQCCVAWTWPPSMIRRSAETSCGMQVEWKCDCLVVASKCECLFVLRVFLAVGLYNKIMYMLSVKYKTFILNNNTYYKYDFYCQNLFTLCLINSIKYFLSKLPFQGHCNNNVTNCVPSCQGRPGLVVTNTTHFRFAGRFLNRSKRLSCQRSPHISRR